MQLARPARHSYRILTSYCWTHGRTKVDPACAAATSWSWSGRPARARPCSRVSCCSRRSSRPSSTFLWTTRSTPRRPSPFPSAGEGCTPPTCLRLRTAACPPSCSAGCRPTSRRASRPHSQRVTSGTTTHGPQQSRRQSTRRLKRHCETSSSFVHRQRPWAGQRRSTASSLSAAERISSCAMASRTGSGPNAGPRRGVAIASVRPRYAGRRMRG
jgi:hypothetical protein